MDAIEGLYKASPPALSDGDQSEILLDNLGRVKVRESGGVVGLHPGLPTYCAIATAFVAYATPTDIFSIYGSSSKTVAVTQLVIAIQATASGNLGGDVIFVKRTAANTGGSPSSLTPTAYDSADAAASASVQTYGAAPSALGTGTTIRRISTPGYTTLTGTASPISLAGFGQLPWMPPAHNISEVAKPIILRGTGEGLCINLNGIAIPAGFAASIQCEWIEF